MESLDAQNLPAILAAATPGEDGADQTGQERKKVYVFHTEDGDVVLSARRLDLQQEPSVPPIVDSQQPQPTAPRRAPPYFVQFLLILLLFVLFDGVNSQAVALLTPTATITIVPRSQQITVTSALQLGRLVSPLTISQSQKLPTTGRGHQDATGARGPVTFYNGSLNPQTIAGGTTYTGRDGVQIVTEEQVTVPAAIPPQFGIATVSSHALNMGGQGNIAAGDINTALSSFLVVKNLAPFTGGADARDFSTVSQQDINRPAATLTQKVTASMSAALQEQLLPTEQADKMPCHPTTTSDHRVGEEATRVQVTVSETCTIVAYNSQELIDQATKLLTSQAGKRLGSGYSLYGSIQVSITEVAILKLNSVILSFAGTGTWLYHIDQKSIITLIAGKPRQEALHLLSFLPGIRRVSIAGIGKNDLLPLEAQHMKFVEIIDIDDQSEIWEVVA